MKHTLPWFYSWNFFLHMSFFALLLRSVLYTAVFLIKLCGPSVNCDHVSSRVFLAINRPPYFISSLPFSVASGFYVFQRWKGEEEREEKSSTFTREVYFFICSKQRGLHVLFNLFRFRNIFTLSMWVFACITYTNVISEVYELACSSFSFLFLPS